VSQKTQPGVPHKKDVFKTKRFWSQREKSVSSKDISWSHLRLGRGFMKKHDGCSREWRLQKLYEGQKGQGISNEVGGGEFIVRPKAKGKNKQHIGDKLWQKLRGGFSNQGGDVLKWGGLYI